MMEILAVTSTTGIVFTVNRLFFGTITAAAGNDCAEVTDLTNGSTRVLKLSEPEVSLSTDGAFWTAF